MASVTASNIVSRSAHGARDVEPKTSGNKKAICLRSQTSTLRGLRSLNKVDSFHKPKNGKASFTQAPKKAVRSGSSKHSGAIVCGLNIVFVSTEVAPWSKTGGLGDVVGGLPPALAVSGSYQLLLPCI